MDTPAAGTDDFLTTVEKGAEEGWNNFTQGIENAVQTVSNFFTGNTGAPASTSAPSFVAPPVAAAPTFSAPTLSAPSFTAAAPSFSAPSGPSDGGGGDFDIGKFFTNDLGNYANTALTWVEANPATFTLWVLVIVVLILACVGIGMAAAMPTSVAPPPPVAPPPVSLPPMPFKVDTNGNVTFPAQVTCSGNFAVNGAMAVAGQSTLNGVAITQQLSVPSLVVATGLNAGTITATGALTSNVNTYLGGNIDASKATINSLNISGLVSAEKVSAPQLAVSGSSRNGKPSEARLLIKTADVNVPYTDNGQLYVYDTSGATRGFATASKSNT